MARRCKVGVQLHPQHTSIEDLRAAWERADALGVDPKAVRVVIADSKLPNAPLSGGSWSATSAGSERP